MARIRTIKPEFWTDEIIVRLPYEARLLFIGLWNFCDDYGVIKYEPERIRLQVFPGDPLVPISALIDLLVSCGLVECLEDAQGNRYLVMRSWQKHQRVDNPARSRVLASPRESYRKIPIRQADRRAVAVKYGAKPGDQHQALCYFCGSPGAIWWPNTSSGKRGAWVAFDDLELDHYVPENKGGSGQADNLVLSCRLCNRGRNDGDPHRFMLRNTSEEAAESREIDIDNRESSLGLDRNGTRLAAEGRGGEKSKQIARADSTVNRRVEPVDNSHPVDNSPEVPEPSTEARASVESTSESKPLGNGHDTEIQAIADLAAEGMKGAGLATVHPRHPKLLSLIAAGMSIEELVEAASDAVVKGKTMAYAMATAEGRRHDAAKLGVLPALRKVVSHEQGIEARARKAGTWPARNGETWDQLEARTRVAEGAGG